MNKYSLICSTFRHYRSPPFHSIIRIHIITKQNVGPLRLQVGNTTVDPAVKATLLSQYFYSVYTVDNDYLPTTSTKATIDPALSSVTFNSTTVFKTLKKLNVRSAGGPDHMPPIFLNKCSNNLSYPSSFYFSCILTLIPYFILIDI